MLLKFTEPVEETGPLEKETKVEGGRSALGEDPYDIRAIKQLKSPTTPTASVKRDIPIRRMQQGETYPLADSADVSLRALGSCPGHFCTAAFYDLATDWRAAEGGRSCVPDETGGHQLCSPQGREPDLTLVSVRRERDAAEIEHNTSLCDLRGNKPHKSHRGQEPDTDVLLSKPEETPRSDSSEIKKETKRTEGGRKSSAAAMAPTTPCDSAFLTPAEAERSESIRKSSAAAMAPTTPCDSALLTPAEAERSERGQRPGADQQRCSLSSERQETDPRRQPVSRDTSNPSSFLPSPFAGTGRTAALTLCFLLLAPMLCSAEGSPCKGGMAMAVQKGQVGLVCPVPTDVHKTGQSVSIIYVHSSTAHEVVLRCDWATHLQTFDCGQSDHGAELVEIQADRVLATLPRDRLELHGFYSGRLSPSHPEKRPSDCSICFPADPTTTTTTVSAVTLSASGDPPKLDDPQTRAHAHPAGHNEGLVTAVVVLSIVVLLLLLLLILFGVGILYLRHMMPRHHQQTRQEWLKTSPVSTPKPPVMHTSTITLSDAWLA